MAARSQSPAGFVLLRMEGVSSTLVELPEGELPLLLGGETWAVVWTEGEAVQIRPASPARPVLVNDVQVQDRARLLPGDLISLDDLCQLLVQRHRFPGRGPVPLTTVELLSAALDGWAMRAARTRSASALLLGVLRGGAPGWLDGVRGSAALEGVLAPLGNHAFALALPGVGAPALDSLRERLGDALGRLGRACLWGWALAPEDGETGEELWARCANRLLGRDPEGTEELPHADPVMARLWSLVELLSRGTGAVVLAGEAGSGRETLARALHRRSGRAGRCVVHRRAAFDAPGWATDLARARGGTLVVRSPEALPPEPSSFLRGGDPRPMVLLPPGPPGLPAEVQLWVPSLAERPADIQPIADHLLARISRPLGRRLSLSPAYRAQISAGPWPGNVRGLGHALLLSALGSDDEELFPAAGQLPIAGAPRLSVREALRRTERRVLAEALHASRWNVTAAARQLGVPRRTLVYRMSRLGLRRPRT